MSLDEWIARSDYREYGSFARYIAVGILNTAFGYSCFAALIYIGMHYAVALLFATIAGILFNFKSIGLLVFSSNDNSKLMRFIGVYLFTFASSLLGLKIFKALGMDPYYGGAVLLLPNAALTFFLHRKFVFNHD